jgi:hypothetical protein
VLFGDRCSETGAVVSGLAWEAAGEEWIRQLTTRAIVLPCRKAHLSFNLVVNGGGTGCGGPSAGAQSGVGPSKPAGSEQPRLQPTTTLLLNTAG